MLTVACVWVRGNVPYSSTYVARLASMVRRNLDRDCRIVCLTDIPRLVPKGVEAIRIVKPSGAGWWAKMQLFSPHVGLKGRVLYLDLDTLVVGPLGPMVDYPEPFALAPDAGNFQPRNGLSVVKRFNSSVMVWNAKEQAELFHRWTPDVMKRLHGDQDFIGEQCPGAATFPLAWVPRLSEIKDEGVIPEAARVVLCKVPKNIEAAARWPWFAARWQ